MRMSLCCTGCAGAGPGLSWLSWQVMPPAQLPQALPASAGPASQWSRHVSPRRVWFDTYQPSRAIGVFGLSPPSVVRFRFPGGQQVDSPFWAEPPELLLLHGKLSFLLADGTSCLPSSLSPRRLRRARLPGVLRPKCRWLPAPLPPDWPSSQPPDWPSPPTFSKVQGGEGPQDGRSVA